MCGILAVRQTLHARMWSRKGLHYLPPCLCMILHPLGPFDSYWGARLAHCLDVQGMGWHTRRFQETEVCPLHELLSTNAFQGSGSMYWQKAAAIDTHIKTIVKIFRPNIKLLFEHVHHRRPFDDLRCFQLGCTRFKKQSRGCWDLSLLALVAVANR